MGSDWVVRRLGDVAHVLLSNVDKKSKPNEAPVKLCNYMDVYKNTSITADLPFMEATATPEQIAKFSLRRGDVMITKDSEDPKDIGVPACVVADFREPVLCGYHLALLRPIGIHGEYLAYALRSPEVNQQFVQRANGSTRFGLTAGVIHDANVPVPPLAEQKKIAQILSSVDEAIEATQAVIDQTRRVKEAMLQTLLTRGLGHTRFKQTEIGEIPEAWEVRLLEDIATRGSGHTPNKQHPEYWNGGIKWVSLTDSYRLDRVYIGETEKQISSAGIANSSAALHPPGIVLVSRDASVGRSAITTESMAVSQHFIVWRCGELLHNHFLYYTLQWLKPTLERIAAGSTIKTIGLPYFKSLQIPLPPKAEQMRIADILLATDKSIWAHEETASQLARVKSALLQTLLSGQTRVTP
jgi:type I restriction enzyme, S subunit